MKYVHNSTIVEESNIADDVKIYKNAYIKECTIKENSIICDNCRIEQSYLGRFSRIYPNGIMYSSQLNDYSYIQKNSAIWYSTIGKFCSISWNVSIGGGDHDFRKVTSHPILYSLEYGFVDKPLYNRFEEKCIVGNDVWIGTGVSILRGAKVGDGSVIGAGAIVTKDIEPYAIVAGVPARKIGQRCEDESIDELLRIKWWDFPTDVIKRNIELFSRELNKNTIESIRQIKQLSIEEKHNGSNEKLT